VNSDEVLSGRRSWSSEEEEEEEEGEFIGNLGGVLFY
jgi:hypothetical protein